MTAGAFISSTWISEAAALPRLIQDDAIRWGVASSFGVAMAALAALWGKIYASDPATARPDVSPLISAGRAEDESPSAATGLKAAQLRARYQPFVDAADAFRQIAAEQSQLRKGETAAKRDERHRRTLAEASARVEAGFGGATAEPNALALRRTYEAAYRTLNDCLRSPRTDPQGSEYLPSRLAAVIDFADALTATVAHQAAVLERQAATPERQAA